jgi:phosphoribosylaminoimidazolecarboxamide formyltransferase / IMP cyclohydrolase
VAIVSSPAQYGDVMAHMQSVARPSYLAHTSLQLRKQLAAVAFASSAAYDAAIASHFSASLSTSPPPPVSPPLLKLSYQHHFSLKYGCNPHQHPASIYLPAPVAPGEEPFSVLNGTPGYINLLDALNAWQLVRELRVALEMPAAASFKHCSPAGAPFATQVLLIHSYAVLCLAFTGAAVGLPLSPAESLSYSAPPEITAVACAYIRARNADPMCSFGDFVAISDTVDECTAQVLKAEVCDGIIAPDFEDSALAILRAKKKGAFIILKGNLDFVPPPCEFREVMGVGFHQRRNDIQFSAQTHLQRVVTSGAGVGLSPAARRDLTLASIAIKYAQASETDLCCMFDISPYVAVDRVIRWGTV